MTTSWAPPASEPPPEGPRHRTGFAGFGCPDPRAIAEEARWLAEPAIAAVSVIAWRGGPSVALVVGGDGAEGADEGLVRAWLATVHRSSPVLVPGPLRARMGGSSALAVPLRTPAWQVGALALPLSAGWGPIARELEALGREFARRFQTADRRAQLAWLRVAVTSPRPPSRFRMPAVGDRVYSREVGPRAATRLRLAAAAPAGHRTERSSLPPDAVSMPLIGRR